MSADHQNPMAGRIAEFNFKALFAFGFATLGWNTWPDRVEDASWGIFSFFIWGAAIGLSLEALRILWKVFTYRKSTEAFRQRGNEVKSGVTPSEKFTTTDGVIKND